MKKSGRIEKAHFSNLYHCLYWTKSQLTEEVQKQIKDCCYSEGLFWEDWMINGYHTFIKGGNTKRAFHTKVWHWIMKSWGLKTPECIKIAFENI